MLHISFVGACLPGYNSWYSEMHGKSPGKYADTDFSRENIIRIHVHKVTNYP
jgi:hypothetical protein